MLVGAERHSENDRAAVLALFDDKNFSASRW